MVTSFIQKLIILRIKDNVQLNVQQILVELTSSVFGVLYVLRWKDTTQLDKLLSTNCGQVMSLSGAQLQNLDMYFNLYAGTNELMNYKYIISVLVIQLTILSVMMLQRTNHLGELIMMLTQMISELGRFFVTFGLLIGLFLLIGRILNQQLQSKIEGSYWTVFLTLFNAFNGKPEFEKFDMPIGQIYIGVFMFMFKVLFVSLLAAMFINRYKVVFKNIDAYRRFSIIKQKNCVSYDRVMGGITTTFFPFNIVILPFILPIAILKSQRASDFILKFQYVLMAVMYSLIAMVIIIPCTPLLYMKLLINSVFIVLNNKRENYKGENVVQLLITAFLSPLIIIISILIDFLSLPNILFKESNGFERKYQQSEDRLSDV